MENKTKINLKDRLYERISDILSDPYFLRLKREQEFRALVENLNESPKFKESIRFAYYNDDYINVSYKINPTLR